MLFNKLKNWLKTRLRNDCLLCGADILEYYGSESSADVVVDFCAQCRNQFTANLYCCTTCSIPLKETGNNHYTELICGHCQKQMPLWTMALTSFTYEYPVDRLLIALKYQRRIDYAKSLALFLKRDVELVYDFDNASAAKPDCIVPVPLHVIRESFRGYNQATLLAHELSKELKLPLNNRLISRKRHTPQQSRLSKKQRAKNLRHAFEVNAQEPIPQYVALLDDVMTTGSTAHAVTKTLLDAGVKRVDVWCIARAE